MAFASDKGRQGAAGQGATGDYEIENSLRLNDDDSAFLSRTPTTAGNSRTFTFSAWVKRGNITGAYQRLFSVYTANNDAGWFDISYVTSSERLRISTYNYSIETSAIFRDPSAWYHIVAVIDTNLAATSDRFKLYINGTRASIASDYGPTRYLETAVNRTVVHQIGSQNTAQYFDGYCV